MKRLWQIGNIASVFFAIIANFLVGAQVLTVPGINEISDKYATILTPATYAFSIWSLIYVLLIVFAVYQARDIIQPTNNNDLPQKLGPLFIIANVANGLWTLIFVQEYIVLSLLTLLVLTASLVAILYRLKIAIFDAPWQVIACVWWPLLIYTGWVVAASVVNFASWLQSINISITPLLAGSILIILTLKLLFLLFTRNVRELVTACNWGILAIAIQQHNDNVSIAPFTFTISALLLAATIFHAYKNQIQPRKSRQN